MTVPPIISVDDHLVEPAGLFEGRVPRDFAEKAPHVVTEADGTELWEFEGRRHPQIGLNAVVGRPKDEWSMEPARFDEMRPGCWDPEARIADMDTDGVYASLCYPSLIAGFAGSMFSQAADADLGLACMRAWNDWHLDEWVGSHPERFIAVQLPWLRDPHLAADEVRRNAERGFKAVSFLENPVDLGMPSMHTDHWDPFLAACEETDTVVCLHCASSGWSASRSPGAQVGGLWDSLLGEGRRWWITSTSDSHVNWRDGGGDFWPGEYSKTYVYANKTYLSVLDGLRNGHVFVTLGDLISSLDVTAWAHNARHEHHSKGHAAAIGETLEVRGKRDVTIVIRLKDPFAANTHGDQPEVSRVDLIVGNVTGRVLDRSLAANPTTRVVKRFGPSDWHQHGEYLTMSYTLRNVTADSYVRVRGTNTDQLEPALDPRGENPWPDLWFYSNPIFIDVRGRIWRQ